ncbi:MAG: GNAT family N-acetyltransferase [Clostridiales bacterium]|nr:GNAT family N-acetyltransferase [Clostridiales bacterium]
MFLLKEKAYKSYSLYRMQEGDFLYVKSFLDRQRNMLDRIEFFYPYKDEELKSVLMDGVFWGLFDGHKLIATFAIDLDEEYAIQIAQIINTCQKSDVVDRAYESSGLMVDMDYRGQGIASFLMDTAVEEAKKRKLNICGVVHTLNAASMSTFFSRSFALRGIWHMCEGYDFVYLLKRYDEENDSQELIKRTLLQNIDKCDIIEKAEYSAMDDCQRHSELLASGYYGIFCKNDRICFIRNNKGERYE